MLGMIKKELYMFKNNLKAIIVAILLYFFYIFAFDLNIIGFLPLMIVMICISSFSYDDFNNWHAYLATIPNGKKNFVKAKYIVTILLMLVSTILTIGITFILSKVNPKFVIDSNIESTLGTVIGMLAIVSIIFPFFFKYNAEKGRMVMVITAISIAGIVFICKQLISPNNLSGLILFLDKNGSVIFPASAIVVTAISYLISNKVYSKREF